MNFVVNSKLIQDWNLVVLLPVSKFFKNIQKIFFKNIQENNKFFLKYWTAFDNKL